jgi:hypothetical protein
MQSPLVRDDWVYAGLLFLLIWAPLPLGGDRTWAMGLMLGLVLLLLAGSALA